MSTKKDKFSKKDIKFMRIALDLARSRKGLTGDNPSVGCVIVKDDNIISIGQTGYNGTPHAEYNAIKNAFNSLKNAKMYVSLEPCNHYGKTPPCTNEIIKSGIKEVFYSIDDIDKKVSGKSFKILSNQKIKVNKGLLKEETNKLYDSYHLNRIKKIPYVTGKIAISKNNLIYSKETKRITDIFSDKLTHFLRYKNDAILVTSKTLGIDNPKLNCRISQFKKFSPIRIILDRNLNIKKTAYVFKTAKKNNTIIFHNSFDHNKIKLLKQKGILLIKLKVGSNKIFDLKKILKILYKYGIRNLLVEGGDKITKNFIKQRLFNQFYLFKSPKKLTKMTDFQNFTSQKILDNKYKKNTEVNYKLVKDFIKIYKK